MAIKGLSIPVFGVYNNMGNGSVKYTNGMINPKAISYTIEIESGDNNPLYGDNMIIEDDVGKFGSGTLTLGTDDLTQDTSVYLLGAKLIQRTYGKGLKSTSVVFDDEQQSPTLGFGIIEEHQIGNVNKYKAVWLKKVAFKIPSDSATTRGESIEWQTKEIEGNIMRSDEDGENGVHPWKEEAWFAKESEALAFLKTMLSVLGTLNVTSVAGSASGKTAITVTPPKLPNGQYYYQTGAELELPESGAKPGSMTQWDGETEIEAATGNKIVIAETVNGEIVNAGMTEVTANDG